MPDTYLKKWQTGVSRIWEGTTHPLALAFLPLALLLLYRGFGEQVLTVAAYAVPLLACGLWLSGVHRTASIHRRTLTSGLIPPDAFNAVVKQVFQDASDTNRHSTIFSIEIDDRKEFSARYGHGEIEAIMQTLGKRLFATFRDGDMITRSGTWSFDVCLQPMKQLDLETCIQLAGRIQTAFEEPVALDNANVYVTSSIGFSQFNRMTATSAQSWQQSARAALVQAQRNGHGSIRAFTAEMRKHCQKKACQKEDVATALASGQIVPWFQPQISTDTGRVTGFEALARWAHPAQGTIPTAEFLGVIEQAGLLERLAEVMLFHSFTALKSWDAAGADVPQVGVNFAGPELNNPHLADKIAWELDRFELSPDRLAVEVLETVVSETPDDVVTRNITQLGRMGCKIDLDDFGTGHASITSIRRFAVNRIKIDRSFVTKSDRDPDQQRMIGAILTMAERMNIETLAEGVETVGEHALLAQLGCGHVQGFGIAKPMPFDDTLDWIAEHNLKLRSTEQIIGNKLR